MITREEQYLNRLAGETEQAIPEPETRKEQYLSRLCGADNIIPETPITREEQYLASLCGEEVEMPEPETRLEQYMAFAGGERESKPEPITRKEQLWDKYQGGGVIEDKTVTGEIISVSDAVEAPAVKLKVTIEPKQEGSGDPSPENIRAITGWTGATATRTGLNQWDEEWELGSISDTTGENQSTSARFRSKNYIPALPNTTYYMYHPNSIARFIYYDANKNFISSTYAFADNREQTTPSNCYYIRFWQTGSEYNNDICINISDTNRNGKYEPYVEPTTATTAFGRTVYGGTVDLVTGELVVDRAMVDLGTLNWSKETFSTTSTIVFKSDVPLKKAGLATLVCSKYIWTNNDRTALVNVDKAIASWNATTSIAIAIRDDSLASGDASAFKTAMQGTQLVYELAEPQTYTLTPQQIEMLAGNNTVWVELINEDTTTQTATSELTYKSRAAQRVLAMNNKLNLNKQALEIKRNGGVIIDKPIIKPIGGGAKL